MAFHVINMSVDAPDGYSFAVQSGPGEDLSVNDIESVSEWILEEWLGFTDAVPEHDEPDNDSSLTELEQDYIFTPSFVFTPFPSSISYLTTAVPSFESHSVPTPVAEIVAPPPNAQCGAFVLY